MTINLKALLAASIITCSVVIASSASATSKAVVIDSNNNVIRSKLSNECVITKWDADVDICSPEAPVQPVPEQRTEAKEHKRSYLTFFNFDKSNLTQTADGIIAKLASDVKSEKSASFSIIGHTDRSGSDNYNLILSQKRALTVKNRLLDHGFSESDIDISWKGESEPLVATDDGIKEPQNRRVEIRVTTR